MTLLPPNIPGVAGVHIVRFAVSRIREIGFIAMNVEEDTP